MELAQIDRRRNVCITELSPPIGPLFTLLKCFSYVLGNIAGDTRRRSLAIPLFGLDIDVTAAFLGDGTPHSAENLPAFNLDSIFSGKG